MNSAKVNKRLKAELEAVLLNRLDKCLPASARSTAQRNGAGRRSVGLGGRSTADVLRDCVKYMPSVLEKASATNDAVRRAGGGRRPGIPSYKAALMASRSMVCLEIESRDESADWVVCEAGQGLRRLFWNVPGDGFCGHSVARFVHSDDIPGLALCWEQLAAKQRASRQEAGAPEGTTLNVRLTTPQDYDSDATPQGFDLKPDHPVHSGRETKWPAVAHVEACMTMHCVMESDVGDSTLPVRRRALLTGILPARQEQGQHAYTPQQQNWDVPGVTPSLMPWTAVDDQRHCPSLAQYVYGYPHGAATAVQQAVPQPSVSIERPVKLESCPSVADVTAIFEPTHPEDAAKIAGYAVPASAVAVIPNGQPEVTEVAAIDDDRSWEPCDLVAAVCQPGSGLSCARSDIFEGMDFIRCLSESSIARCLSGASLCEHYEEPWCAA